MKENYIETITTLLEKCDIITLDLIQQILIKKIQNS